MGYNSDKIERAIRDLRQYYNVLGKSDFFQHIIERARSDIESGGAAELDDGDDLFGDATIANRMADLIMGLSDGGIYAYEFLTDSLWEGELTPGDKETIKSLVKVICPSTIVPTHLPLPAEEESELDEDQDPDTTVTVSTPPPLPPPSNHPATLITDSVRTFENMLSVNSSPALDLGGRFSEITIPRKSASSLVAFQVYPCYLNLSQRDTGALQLFLSSIPPLEWSRASPYLSVEIITPQAGVDALGNVAGISSLRFLHGKTTALTRGTVASRVDPMHAMATAQSDSLQEIIASAEEQHQQAMDMAISEDFTEQQRQALMNNYARPNFSSAGMEVFTSPQTLVPADETYKSFDSQPDTFFAFVGDMAQQGDPWGVLPGNPASKRIAPVNDRNRPFMSITSFEVTVQPSDSFSSTKSAKLHITLHDRSRLGEIGPLVKPDNLGRTEILVEYGWSHPAGFANNSEGEENAYGQLINSMRVKEKYGVFNTAYSFTEDNQVLITLDMITRGAISLDYIDIALDPRSRASWMEIQNLTQTVAAQRESVLGTTGFEDVTGMDTIAMISPTSLGDVFSGESADEINSFVDFVGPEAGSSVGDLRDSVARLRDSIVDQRRTMNDAYEEKMRVAKNGVDPFLYDNNGNWILPTNRFYVRSNGFHQRRTTRFVSFGKLMMLFVGMPLAVSGKFDEVQLLFYNFNERAGWMKGKNIGSFPISLTNQRRSGRTDFHTRFRGELEKYINWPIGRFVNWVKEVMFSSFAAPGWGLSEIYTYKSDGAAATRGERDVDVRGQGVPNEAVVDPDGGSGRTYFERFVNSRNIRDRMIHILQDYATTGVSYSTQIPIFQVDHIETGETRSGAGDPHGFVSANPGVRSFPNRDNWAYFLISLFWGHPDIVGVGHPFHLNYGNPSYGRSATGGTGSTGVGIGDTMRVGLFGGAEVVSTYGFMQPWTPYWQYYQFPAEYVHMKQTRIISSTSTDYQQLVRIYQKWFGSSAMPPAVPDGTDNSSRSFSGEQRAGIFNSFYRPGPWDTSEGLFGGWDQETSATVGSFGQRYPSFLPDQLDPIISQDMNMIMRIFGINTTTGLTEPGGTLAEYMREFTIIPLHDDFNDSGSGEAVGNPWMYFDKVYVKSFATNPTTSISPGDQSGVNRAMYTLDGPLGEERPGGSGVYSFEQTRLYQQLAQWNGIDYMAPRELALAREAHWETHELEAYPPGANTNIRIMIPTTSGRGGRDDTLSAAQLVGEVATPRIDAATLSQRSRVEFSMASALRRDALTGGEILEDSGDSSTAMLHASGYGTYTHRSDNRNTIITGIRGWEPVNTKLGSFSNLYEYGEAAMSGMANPLWVAAAMIGLAPGEDEEPNHAGGRRDTYIGPNTADSFNQTGRNYLGNADRGSVIEDNNFDIGWADRNVGHGPDTVPGSPEGTGYRFQAPALEFSIEETGNEYVITRSGTSQPARGRGAPDDGRTHTFDDHYRNPEGHFDSFRISISYDTERWFCHPEHLKQDYKDLWRAWFVQDERVRSFQEDAFATYITVQTNLGWLTAKRQDQLARAYYGRSYAPGMDISFRLPALRMIIETIPHRDQATEMGTTSDSSGTICRVHFVDEAAMKYPSLGKLLREAKDTELGQLSGIMTEYDISENPDPARYAQQIAETIQSLQRNGIIELAEVPPVGRTTRDGDWNQLVPRHRIVGGPAAIKNFIKRNMPSIVFGTQNSAIISAQAKTMNNSRDMTIHLLRQTASEGDSIEVGSQDLGLAMKMLPFNLTLTMFGCPLLHHTQQMFIDFGTNTTVDNIFAITGIKHVIQPGKFTSSCKLIPIHDAYGVYQGLLETTFDATSELGEISRRAREEIAARNQRRKRTVTTSAMRVDHEYAGLVARAGIGGVRSDHPPPDTIHNSDGTFSVRMWHLGTEESQEGLDRLIEAVESGEVEDWVD